MRRCGLGALLTLVLLLALGAQADATTQTFVVAPGSARVTTPCTAATPCEFKYAIGAAQQGDDVLFKAGEYDWAPPTPSAELQPNPGVTLHGTPGQPLPVIKQTAGFTTCTCAMLGLQLGDVARDLALNQAAQNTVNGHPAGPLEALSSGVTMERLLITGVGGGMYFYGSGTTSVLRDSVIVANDGAGVTMVAPATVSLENLTVLAHGSGSAFSGLGISAAAVSGGSFIFNVVNTIARGDTHDLSVSATAGSTARINAHYSDFRNGAFEQISGSGATIPEDHSQRGNPLFAGAGDYHELISSPTVDAGTASGLGGSLDLSGAARAIGAAPDIGAYEFAGGAPLVTTGSPAAVAGSSATLPATVDAQDLATSYSFSYGPTSAYGSHSPAASLPAAIGLQAVSATLSGLAAGTYHYAITATNSAGPRTGADQSFTIAAGASSQTSPAVLAPSLSALTLSSGSFRAAASGASALAARARVRPRPTGTVLSYTDSEAATTTFTVTRTAAGARSGRSCVAPSRRLRHAKHCTRTLTLGSFTHADAAGANRLRFSGRVRARRLAPGRYTLSALARSSAGLLGTPRSVGFRIVA